MVLFKFGNMALLEHKQVTVDLKVQIDGLLLLMYLLLHKLLLHKDKQMCLTTKNIMLSGTVLILVLVLWSKGLKESILHKGNKSLIVFGQEQLLELKH